MADETVDERITKRRVTMTNYDVEPDADGTPVIKEYVVMDYVRPDILDAYVADAKERWKRVTVSDEPDAGPGGYHGQTVVPAALDHPLAGAIFAATSED